MPDTDAKVTIIKWLMSSTAPPLSPSPSMSTVSCPEYPELQEKLHRLIMARDSLSLQVSVLTEQVDAQKEKIRDLDTLLNSKQKMYLNGSVENTPELDKGLLGEISDLKTKFEELTKDKSETEQRLQMSHAEMEKLGRSMQGIIAQHGGYQHVLPRLIDQSNSYKSGDPSMSA
jgi:chromosome segregation ATPase